MNQRDQIPPMEVVVHKKGWQTETVRVQHLGALKDLGYYLDTDLGGEQQFKVTLQRLTTALEAMKYKFPSTKEKEYALRMASIPRVAYTGQGANLTDAQISKL